METGENPTTTMSSRGRKVVAQDYRKLAGEQEGSALDTMDVRSQTSKRSKKSAKLTKSKTVKQVVNNEELDSHAGDFEGEGDDISLGSDASRMTKLQDEIEGAGLTLGECYNEMKVAQGLQV